MYQGDESELLTIYQYVPSRLLLLIAIAMGCFALCCVSFRDVPKPNSCCWYHPTSIGPNSTSNASDHLLQVQLPLL